MIDEYKIKPILAKHGISEEAVCKDLSEHFDKFCNAYMDNRKTARDAAFTEMNCFLMMALMDDESGKESLKDRIKLIVDSISNRSD